ncbi:hypothetical protein AAT19DRAFT_9335 [Rhodotorula toruloides]|uniref:CBM20 domain-containing protein n=1 Tax=Rhodotorula toruloides TaxID=5286 RepID=A0A2T0A1V8_RHOTO|nr:hypothetical protein AAT19DRAFT_9335 [Rhodotorula toruloides]
MEVSPAPLSPAYKPMSITGTPLASAELDKAFPLGPALHEPTETTFVPQEPIDAGQISRVVLLNLRIDFLTPEEADKVRVFITGNHETVGFWNPVEGLELRRVGVNEWEAPMPVKPEQVGKLQFKAVIIRPDAEPQFEREHRENRVWHGESRLDFTWEA